MRILLVDDSRMFLRLVERVLSSRMDAEIDTAGSLSEARELIADNSYDVALLDIVLPDAPAGEVVDYVVSMGIPVVAFTGRFDEGHREHILKKKVVDYVIKNNLQSASQLVDIVERLQKNCNIRILVVDDSAVVRQNICSALEAYRFQTIDAKDGEVAFQLLEEHPDIRLVISDYNMPGLDGFQLLEKIRQKWTRAELPFIGVSGNDAPFLSARFLKLGANDFLAKPFTREELYSRVLNNIEMLEFIQELKKLDEQKNRFLGMAAHDLRNPINGISGFSELLLELSADKLDAQEREFLGLIHQSSGEMLSIVNDLLDLNAIQTGNLEIRRKRDNLGDVINGRLKLFDTMAQQKGITLVFNRNTSEDILLDRIRISQVLDNLISNAVKFSPADSSIEIALDESGDSAVVSVRDSGPGISSDDLDKLFIPFSKASARPTGGEASTGLGLAITKRIVEAHGGRVTVESTLGEGSCFAFEIPRH